MLLCINSPYILFTEAENVNWDDKTLKDFVNDVVKHGLTCMHSGMKILLQAADLDGVKGKFDL